MGRDMATRKLNHSERMRLLDMLINQISPAQLQLLVVRLLGENAYINLPGGTHMEKCIAFMEELRRRRIGYRLPGELGRVQPSLNLSAFDGASAAPSVDNTARPPAKDENLDDNSPYDTVPISREDETPLTEQPEARKSAPLASTNRKLLWILGAAAGLMMLRIVEPGNLQNILALAALFLPGVAGYLSKDDRILGMRRVTFALVLAILLFLTVALLTFFVPEIYAFFNPGA
jgi:hypothetical protein